MAIVLKVCIYCKVARDIVTEFPQKHGRTQATCNRCKLYKINWRQARKLDDRPLRVDQTTVCECGTTYKVRSAHQHMLSFIHSVWVEEKAEQSCKAK